MPEFTPRANLYLPGGGLSGTIPNEEADIDKLNDNFRKLDSLLGASHVLSTERPSTPVDGQLIYESDTRNVLSYSADLLKWLPVGVPNCPSIAYRDGLFGALPSVGARCIRTTNDNSWAEVWVPAKAGFGAMNTAGWLREGGVPLHFNSLAANTGQSIAGGSIVTFLDIEVALDVATRCTIRSTGLIYAPGNAAGYLQKGYKRPGDTEDQWDAYTGTQMSFAANTPVRWHSNGRVADLFVSYDSIFILPAGTNRLKLRAIADPASVTQNLSNFSVSVTVGV